MNIQYKYLDIEYFEQVINLQQNVLNSMVDKTKYFPLEIAEIDFLLTNKKSLSLGAFVDNKLIAFRSLTINENSLWKKYIDNKNISEEYGYFEATFVLSKFQGLNLQNKMSKQILDIAKTDFKTNVFFSLVAYHNYPSIIDKFKLGFYIIDTMNIYNNKKRFVFYYNQKEKHSKNQTIWTENFTQQENLLRNGYIGTDYQFIDNTFKIKFS